MLQEGPLGAGVDVVKYATPPVVDANTAVPDPVFLKTVVIMF